jgi:hypothetical protein
MPVAKVNGVGLYFEVTGKDFLWFSAMSMRETSEAGSPRFGSSHAAIA